MKAIVKNIQFIRSHKNMADVEHLVFVDFSRLCFGIPLKGILNNVVVK